jgi:hypothetical protein
VRRLFVNHPAFPAKNFRVAVSCPQRPNDSSKMEPYPMLFRFRRPTAPDDPLQNFGYSVPAHSSCLVAHLRCAKKGVANGSFLLAFSCVCIFGHGARAVLLRPPANHMFGRRLPCWRRQDVSASACRTSAGAQIWPLRHSERATAAIGIFACENVTRRSPAADGAVALTTAKFCIAENADLRRSSSPIMTCAGEPHFARADQCVR